MYIYIYAEAANSRAESEDIHFGRCVSNFRLSPPTPLAGSAPSANIHLNFLLRLQEDTLPSSCAHTSCKLNYPKDTYTYFWSSPLTLCSSIHFL